MEVEAIWQGSGKRLSEPLCRTVQTRSNIGVGVGRIIHGNDLGLSQGRPGGVLGLL